MERALVLERPLPRRPGGARLGPLGPEPEAALGLVHPGRPDHPALGAAAGDARLGHRLRARPRARRTCIEPGHDAAFWGWVDRYPQAERAKGYLLGWSAAAKVDPPPGQDDDRLDAGAATCRVDGDRRRDPSARVRPVRCSRAAAARRPATSGRRVDSSLTTGTAPAGATATKRTSRWCTSPRLAAEGRPGARRGAPAPGRGPARRAPTPRSPRAARPPASEASPGSQWPPSWNQRPALACRVSSTCRRSAETTSAPAVRWSGRQWRYSRVGVRVEVRDVPLPQRLLAGVGRDPAAEQAQRRGVEAHSSRASVGGAVRRDRRAACAARRRSPPRSAPPARSAPSRKPSGSSRSAAVGSRSGCIHTPSRASVPCRVRSEPHSVEASRSRRGRSSRPTRVAKVCSAGPPAARRRRTASCSLRGVRHPPLGGLADDLVDPALDQRERDLEPLQRGLLGGGVGQLEHARPRAAAASPRGWSGRCRASAPRPSAGCPRR